MYTSRLETLERFFMNGCRNCSFSCIQADFFVKFLQALPDFPGFDSLENAVLILCILFFTSSTNKTNKK